MILQEEMFRSAAISLIVYFFIVLGNLLLIISGIKYYKEKTRINSSRLFIIAGSLNTLWILFFPRVVVLIVRIYELDYRGFDLLYWILGNITTGIFFIFTYGIFFIIIGVKNKRDFGKFLEFSGILKIIGIILLLISSLILDSYIYLDISPPNRTIRFSFNIMFIFGVCFEMISIIFFMVYSIKLIYGVLGISGVLFILGAFLTFLLNFYLSTHHLFLL